MEHSSSGASQIKYVLSLCLLLILGLIGVASKQIPDNVPQVKYDVFVNFRGEDIRRGFLGHLTKAFDQNQISAFVDDKLEKGDEIWPSLVGAIQGSLISLTIFSGNYFSSRWCLEELVKILECREKYGQTVIPVFYDVNPTDVRHQNGSYGKALAEHEKKYNLTTVQNWRHALKKTADLSGIKSSDYKTEVNLLEEIINIVNLELMSLDKLPPKSTRLIGINKPIQHLEPLLHQESKYVRVIGIWGMGGIGKTTIAKEIYNKLCSKYDGCYFLENVKEESRKKGTISLKEELFSGLLGENLKNKIVPQLSNYIKRKISRMKVLIVLDDVNDPALPEKLFENNDWFGQGSSIIITTRDKQVLIANNVDEISIYHKILLDLACFFIGLNLKVDHIKVLLKDSETDDSVIAGLSRLEDKALITISEDNAISMHDIIQEMAWEIVRLESIEDPGSRSRLRYPDEIYEVLENNKGTEAVRSIRADLSLIRKVELSSHIFTKMSKLQFLYLPSKYNQDGFALLPQGLQSFPVDLRYLVWGHYPLKSLPENFSAKSLVILDIENHLSSLRYLSLRACGKLSEFSVTSENMVELDLSSTHENYGDYNRSYGSYQVKYVYPGSRVPEWLELKTRKDYIIIDLSSTSPSALLGFIFSFIISGGNGVIGLRFSFYITISDDEDESKKGTIDIYISDRAVLVASDHVYVIYDQRCSHYLLSRAKNQTRLKIKVMARAAGVGILQRGVGLKGFGISPINTSAYDNFMEHINTTAYHTAVDHSFIQQINTSADHSFIQQNSSADPSFIQQLNTSADHSFIQQVNSSADDSFIQEINTSADDSFIQQINTSADDSFIQQMEVSVLGRLLCEKDKEFWESQLNKLKNMPNIDVYYANEIELQRTKDSVRSCMFLFRIEFESEPHKNRERDDSVVGTG
ncbi:TMV resistance protein N, partial [Mucuna pruriens]